MEDLVDIFASSSVSDANSTVGEHPRFVQYKNTGRRIENQEKRRREYLDRQKEARFDYANHARKLAMNEFDEEDEKMEIESEEEGKTVKKRRYKTNRYADELMLSEWLVDMPEADSLSQNWIFIPCPVGKRCLVVASNGVTTAYNKAGRLIKQFPSYLPGGNRSNSCGGYSIVDCIFSNEQSKNATFYCLDLIAWNGVSLGDSGFDCRLFFLRSRIEENDNFNERSKQNSYRFSCLPSCHCETKQMEEMMKRDFDFTLDGVLFYHSDVQYRPGQNPLVGWLKPWMLPEILSVSIPQSLMGNYSSTRGTSQEFIDEFNKQYHHRSLISKDQ